MSATDEPRPWTRLVAALHGEVRAETLEAYRRAGAGAYELLDRAELRRAELTIQQADPWSTDPATKAFLLCTWNAFTLQLLGDEFLDADYRANPTTAGFVPPVTARQALAFYGQVEGWLSRANQAASNPAYRLDVHVPAELPEWAEAEPCPREHLEAMLSACRRLRRHTEVAFGDIEKAAGPERSAALGHLRQRLAVATTAADYAERLYQPDAAREQHERAEDSVRRAIEAAYELVLISSHRPSPRAWVIPRLRHLLMVNGVAGNSFPGTGPRNLRPDETTCENPSLFDGATGAEHLLHLRPAPFVSRRTA